MSKAWLIISIIIIALILTLVWWVKPKVINNNQPDQAPKAPIMNNIDDTLYREPIAEFSDRITKKPFGIYVSPNNSPVSPERFTGYHTAVDIEYDDINTDVPVYAIADGKIVVKRTANGYGGLMVIEHNINNLQFLSLYGHLDPASYVSLTEIKKGDQIAILGDGYTTETDDERKHLHFGLIKSTTIDIRGYVQSKDELNKWYDPVEFLKQ